MNLLASLPWYDLPGLRSQHDAFWRVLRDELRGQGARRLPSELDRTTPLVRQWQRPGLVISQCCSKDLGTPAADWLEPIARPVFAELDCPAGQYYSHIVTASRRQRFPRRFVVNSLTSRSGYTALMQWATDHGLVRTQLLISGSHQRSLQMLRAGVADLAAIDAHSWTLLDAAGIRIIGRSGEAPAPPFVRHRACPVASAPVVEALERAIDQAGALMGVGRVLPADAALYRAGP